MKGFAALVALGVVAGGFAVASMRWPHGTRDVVLTAGAVVVLVAWFPRYIEFLLGGDVLTDDEAAVTEAIRREVRR